MEYVCNFCLKSTKLSYTCDICKRNCYCSEQCKDYGQRRHTPSDVILRINTLQFDETTNRYQNYTYIVHGKERTKSS